MELANVLSALRNRCAVVTSRLSRHGETSALVLQAAAGTPWPALKPCCQAWARSTA